MSDLLTLDKIKKVTSKINYLNWRFFADKMGDGFYVQVRFDAPDAYTGKMEDQHGRKWYVSKYSTVDELVRTCFLAVMIASEHEIRENFLYEEKMVFGPHISVNSLTGVSDNIVKRKEIKK